MSLAPALSFNCLSYESFEMLINARQVQIITKLALQFRRWEGARKDGNPEEFQHKEQLAPTETGAYMLYQNAKLHYGKTVSCPMGG
jgi:hypothetical protein